MTRQARAAAQPRVAAILQAPTPPTPLPGKVPAHLVRPPYDVRPTQRHARPHPHQLPRRRPLTPWGQAAAGSGSEQRGTPIAEALLSTNPNDRAMPQQPHRSAPTSENATHSAARVGNTPHGFDAMGIQQRNDLSGSGHLALRVFGNIFSRVEGAIGLEKGAPGSLTYVGGYNDVFASGGVFLPPP